MPLFSKKFVDFIIEPTWKLVASLQVYYLEKIVSGKEIVFSQEELRVIEAENHNYSRGYESDEEEETYGLEGLIKELMKFLKNSLENNQVKKKLKSFLPAFLICIKNYCIMSNETISLWSHDQNSFVMEDFNIDYENASSLRLSSIRLVQSIMKKIDQESAFRFIKVMISEFQSDQSSNDIYSALTMLDNSENVDLLINNLNQNKDYIMRKFEANLFILSEVTDNLKILMKKNILDSDKVKEIILFLHGILLQSSKSILSERAIWCLSKISYLLQRNKQLLLENFSFISNLFFIQNNNLSTDLISSKSLKEIADLITRNNNHDKSENYLEPNLVILILNKNIELLKLSSEETIVTPIECLLAISKLNMQTSLAHSVHLINQVLQAYLKNLHDVSLTRNLSELIEFWSKNPNTEKLILEFFIHLFLYLSDEYFNRFSKKVCIQKYLETRKIFGIQTNERHIRINSETITVFFIFKIGLYRNIYEFAEK